MTYNYVHVVSTNQTQCVKYNNQLLIINFKRSTWYWKGDGMRGSQGSREEDGCNQDTWYTGMKFSKGKLKILF